MLSKLQGLVRVRSLKIYEPLIPGFAGSRVHSFFLALVKPDGFGASPRSFTCAFTLITPEGTFSLKVGSKVRFDRGEKKVPTEG
jgi:hypothetical protein